jgi:hypothetical protein
MKQMKVIHELDEAPRHEEIQGSVGIHTAMYLWS